MLFPRGRIILQMLRTHIHWDLRETNSHGDKISNTSVSLHKFHSTNVSHVYLY